MSKNTTGLSGWSKRSVQDILDWSEEEEGEQEMNERWSESQSRSWVYLCLRMDENLRGYVFLFACFPSLEPIDQIQWSVKKIKRERSNRRKKNLNKWLHEMIRVSFFLFLCMYVCLFCFLSFLHTDQQQYKQEQQQELCVSLIANHSSLYRRRNRKFEGRNVLFIFGNRSRLCKLWSLLHRELEGQ